MRQHFEAVVFDFGGVIGPNPFQLLDRHAVKVGLPTGAIKGYFQAGWRHLAELETGRMTSGEFMQKVADDIKAKYQHDLNLAEMKGVLGEILVPTDDSLELVREVKLAGRRVALLSNNVRDLSALWRTADIEDLFEVIIDSSAVGLHKPEPMIYQFTLDRLDCIPSHAIFIDDLPSNLEPAKDLGMATIHFESVAQCRQELIRLGVLPPKPSRSGCRAPVRTLNAGMDGAEGC